MRVTLTFLIAILLAIPAFAKGPKKTDFSKVYSEKKFYFSGWGAPSKKATDEEQTATLQKPFFLYKPWNIRIDTG